MCWKLLDFLNFNAQTKTHNELAPNCVKMAAQFLYLKLKRVFCLQFIDIPDDSFHGASFRFFHLMSIEGVLM